MTDFDSLGALDDTDIRIAVYALRTFRVVDGNVSSVAVGAGHWDGGICTAVCVRTKDGENPHTPPADGCMCGIYGTHSLHALFAQYPEFACRITTVIAVGGPTVTGSTGLRTAQVRVVAYWVGEPDGSEPSEAEVCGEQFPGARRYYDIDLMAKLYGMRLDPGTGWSRERKENHG